MADPCETWRPLAELVDQLCFGPPNLPSFTIVGAVKDVHERGYELAMKPAVYVPTPQMPGGVSDVLIVQGRQDPLALSAAAQRVIAGIDPSQPVMVSIRGLYHR
jgi:hypothetical protein